jgi:proteasome lid subunit RPN8/RPN11
VYWTPWKHWVSGSRFYSPYEIVVSQPVLATIREHIAADLDREVLGLLGGELLVCPETLRRWIKVEEALEPVPPAPVGVNGENLEQALLPLVAEARGKGWSPIGWYHVCGRKSFNLSETEVDIHARYFSLPWHVLLLVLADLGRPAGGIFVRSESGRLSRNQYRPFYELLRDDAQLSNGRVRTFVGWQNYMTDAPIVRAFSQADEVNGWSAAYPAVPPAGRQRARTTRRVAIAAALAGLAVSGWAMRDRLPYQPFEGFSSLIEFASPAESEPAAEPPAVAYPESSRTGAGGSTTVPNEGTLARFYALASTYERAAIGFLRGEVDCLQLAGTYQAVTMAYTGLTPGSGEGGDEFLDVAGRLNRSIDNGTANERTPARTDPEVRMQRIQETFTASGCELP